MDKMDKIDIQQQALIFTKARNNLLAVIAFTAINLILTAFDSGVSFLFSATLPQFVLEIGQVLDSEMERSFFTIVGLVFACIIIITYFVFWILAKRIRVFILVALIFFGIDTLALLYVISNMEFNFSLLLQIAFHGWVLYYLVNGVKAWSKTRDVSTDVFNVIMQEIKSNNKGPTGLAVPDEPDRKIPDGNDSADK